MIPTPNLHLEANQHHPHIPRHKQIMLRSLLLPRVRQHLIHRLLTHRQLLSRCDLRHPLLSFPWHRHDPPAQRRSRIFLGPCLRLQPTHRHQLWRIIRSRQHRPTTMEGIRHSPQDMGLPPLRLLTSGPHPRTAAPQPITNTCTDQTVPMQPLGADRDGRWFRFWISLLSMLPLISTKQRGFGR